MNLIRILILTANPAIPDRDPLQLDKEIRQIEDAIRDSNRRDCFQVKVQVATRTKDLRRALFDHNPQIVHFSGHGSGEGGLILENDEGKPQLVSTSALAGLFGVSETPSVECVLLNACDSEDQVSAIHQYVDCVIGMRQPIKDRSAILFSEGFYGALGAGKSYEEAHKAGCSAIALEGIPQDHIPMIKHRKRLPVEPPSQPEEAPIAEAPARSFGSISFGNITNSGSNSVNNAIQSPGNVTFSGSISQINNSNQDLQAALEALIQLKQEISATDALSDYAKKESEFRIDTLENELKKPKLNKSFIDEVVEALKKGLEGVVALATPVTQVAALIAKAYVGM